jgi:hypothetical protein
VTHNKTISKTSSLHVHAVLQDKFVHIENIQQSTNRIHQVLEDMSIRMSKCAVQCTLDIPVLDNPVLDNPVLAIT